MDIEIVRQHLREHFHLVSAMLRCISENLGTEAQKEGDAGTFARELAWASLDDAERALDAQGNMIGSTIAVHFDPQLNQELIQLRLDLCNLRREVAQLHLNSRADCFVAQCLPTSCRLRPKRDTTAGSGGTANYRAYIGTQGNDARSPS